MKATVDAVADVEEAHRAPAVGEVKADPGEPETARRAKDQPNEKSTGAPGHGSARPDDSEAIVALCRKLAETFKTRASKYDQEGSFPVENFADLKEAGLLSIMIPKSHGGMGADFLTYTRALEQLAIGDAATALTYNMHNIAVGVVAELPEDIPGTAIGRAMTGFRDWMFKEAVEGKKVFASATSEPGIGAHISKLKTT